MKKTESFLVLAVISCLVFCTSCDSGSGSSGSGGSEATLLGETLVFSGTVDQTFDTDTHTLNAGYTNSDDRDFILSDETDDTVYFTDDNGDEALEINYTGTTHLAHLYNPAGGGITSSNSSAEITTAVIEVSDSDDEIMYGDFSSVPASWYYYLYSSAETLLDGSYTDEGKTYTFDNVKVFEGWNRLICSTSDGSTFSYSGGTISSGHWTYLDNLDS